VSDRAAEYLVEIHVHLPGDLPPGERRRRLALELERGRELHASRAIQRIWRVPGALRNVGIWSARDATELHELIHWSGSKKRLDRDLSGRFGTQSYAAEELVAELGAAFLCAHLGIEGKLRHAEYIANWLELLKKDSRAIFTAASRASAAADYLRSFSETVQEEAA